MAEKRERVFNKHLELPDGRKVRVTAYDDGSVRFVLGGAPYVIQEAFLGGMGNDGIVMLSPGGQGSAAMRGKVSAPDEQLS
ncbi:hypothetical protein [Streptomyces sp. NBC_00620]|uniref:hypothetical protein n=1 Tax=Streptomyces sp. NBC_00620 TaxID=2903666 RepID=UPI00225193AB|nr:hypothetical protein [Streptomyces sp. NBC_00620]MCX4976244.1 hypothetical protein [Streptomyces sp. NBC_00620]